MVRYAVGPLREWLKQTIGQAPASPAEQRMRASKESLGFDESIPRGGRRKKLPADTFERFVALCQTGDEWPFIVQAPQARPVDFISALASDATDEDTSAWLSLEAFADQLGRALLHEEAQQSAKDLDEVFSSHAFPIGYDERLWPSNRCSFCRTKRTTHRAFHSAVKDQVGKALKLSLRPRHSLLHHFPWSTGCRLIYTILRSRHLLKHPVFSTLLD